MVRLSLAPPEHTLTGRDSALGQRAKSGVPVRQSTLTRVRLWRKANATRIITMLLALLTGIRHNAICFRPTRRSADKANRLLAMRG